MWTACVGQLTELHQEALKQALQVESWLTSGTWPRHPQKPRVNCAQAAEISSVFMHEMRPIFCWLPLPWTLKNYDFITSETKRKKLDLYYLETPKWKVQDPLILEIEMERVDNGKRNGEEWNVRRGTFYKKWRQKKHKNDISNYWCNDRAVLCLHNCLISLNYE